jgi:hypothetical protein
MALIPFERFKGLNNLMSVTDKGLRWLEQALNIDITNQGGWKTRKGYDNLLSVNGHSLWSDGNICLYRTGTTLMRLFPNLTTATLRTGLSPNRLPMSYLSLIGKIYYSDGRDNGIIEFGASRSWGLALPKAPICTTIGGFLTKGIYRVILTYMRNDGQESGSSLPTLIELSAGNSGIRVITEPSLDATVSYICVYVTTPNGTSFRLFHKVTNAINTVDIIDVKSVNNLTVKLETENLETLPPGVLINYYKSRILLVENYNIWCSMPFSYELCKRESDYVSFETPIRMLAVVEDGLWVGLDNVTYFLLGETPPYKIDKIIPYGVIEGQWASDVAGEKLLRDDIKGKVCLWSSTKGICVGGTGGYFLNLTENTYNFPIALTGHGFVRENDEMNQFILFLKDAIDNPNVESAFKNSANLELPGFTINAVG